MLDQTRRVDAHLQEHPAIDRLVLRPRGAVAIGFLHEYLNHLTDRALAHEPPHHRVAGREGRASHFVKLFSAAPRRRENLIELRLGERGGLFRINVFARFEAADGVARLIRPPRRAQRNQRNRRVCQQGFKRRVARHTLGQRRGRPQSRGGHEPGMGMVG